MPDFGFVGGAYEAANPGQDSQELINWYVELDHQPGAKTPTALLGVPGLEPSVTSLFSGEVRAGHVMPGGKIAYWVIGSALVKMTVATAATSTSYAKFSLTQVGKLLSSTGQVCMRDNGVGGVLAITDGATLYAYLTNTGTFRVVNDPAVYACDRIASIDGTLYFNKSGTQIFFASPIYWNGTAAFDGTYFALKDDAPDNLVTLMEANRQLWLVGEKTTEVWIPGGGTNFQLSRLPGAMLQVGCAAKNTIVRNGKTLIWLAASERGENYLVRTNGYDYEPIENPAFSYALTQYKVISDAFAYVYAEEGHEFYVITFPTADATWVLDMSTQLWHKRQSYGGHRQRSNCLINFQGQRIVGDYQNGKLWRQSRKVYSDGPDPLVALRRTGYVWDGGDRNRIVHSRLQVEFRAGPGLDSGQGSDPQAMLRWKDEKGWSNEHTTGIGKVGETDRRAIWRKLGSARSRLYEVSVSDPVARDVVGASLEAGGTKA